MELTDREQQVVQRLRKQRVAAAVQVANQLKVSIKTVRRALIKVGYYSSINCNSAFVTLQQTPRFDSRGLWLFQKKICFSRHDRLLPTLKALIERSPDGKTVQELQQAVHTRVHNAISLLLRQGEIREFYLGRHTVYTANDAPRRELQRQKRLPKHRPSLPPVGPDVPKEAPVPPGADPVTVIRLLVRIIDKPTASTASLSKSLQAQGVAIDAEQIRQILGFYGLKKTTR